MDVDAVVVGSGAGGLTAAVALARAGQRVLVLEQHTLPGGWCHSFDLHHGGVGYRFSPGVHYLGELGPGGHLRRVYEGLGLDLAFRELDPDGYDQVAIGDRFRFDFPRGRQVLADRLCARFPADADAIRTFLDRMSGMARELAAASEARGIAALATPIRAPHLTRFGLVPLSRLLRGIRDPYARAVLSAQTGDHGMAPSRCPSGLHAAVMGHYFAGAYYPQGGGRALPKALIAELRAHGGRIQVGAKVVGLDLERRRVVGVRLDDGRRIATRTVVSNADPHGTAALLGDHLPTRWRLRLGATTYGASSVSLFLAARVDPAKAGMTSGNRWVFRDPDVEAMYRYADDPDPLARGPVPAAFLTCTTCKDPTERHPGVATFEAFGLVSYTAFARFAETGFGERPEAYVALKETLADRILELVETQVPGLSAGLEVRDVGTPLTNRHYVAATHGAMYGTEKRASQLGPLGWGPGTPITGLWTCGASSMGHGVATATFSGLATAAAILGVRGSELLTGRGKVQVAA